MQNIDAGAKTVGFGAGRIFIIISLLVLSGSGLIAQDYATLRGKVVDQDNQPVSFAHIILEGTDRYVVADEYGSYALPDVPPGTYQLSARSVGYQAAYRNLAITRGESLVVNFSLETDISELTEVVVKGERYRTEAEKLKISGFSVNALDIQQFQNANIDVNTLLSRTSGVKVREQGGMGSNFEFSINGLSGKQVRYFIDGVPMDVFGSSMSLNNIPVNLAERIEVYKGVVPVSLGADAMGGAVNIITNNTVKNYLDLSYSLASFNTHRAAVSGQHTLAGIGLIIRANAFYNYSDNNYIMKDVEVWNEEQYEYETRDLRRFHDHYRAGMARIEAGVVNRKWADAFFIGGSLGSIQRDIQNGFRQHIVYGKVAQASESFNATMSYAKDSLLLNRLNANIFAAVSDDRSVTYDTAFRQFSWDGSSVNRGWTEREGRQRSIYHIIRPGWFLRGNLNYTFSEMHSLNLNYVSNQIRNEAYNEVTEQSDNVPGVLRKDILGLAYQVEAFEKRLVAQVFGKYYGLNLSQVQYSAILHAEVKNDTTFRNYGYGMAMRYKVFPNTGIKVSLEHTYRLQEVDEMFGDGLNTTGNPLLTPEYSDNINLGLYHEIFRKPHRWFFETGTFLRDAHDFIYAVPYESSNIMQYENQASVNVTGIEGDIRYTYADMINLSVNATYQNAINNKKFSKPGQTVPDVTYLNKLPNRPWFFGNVNIGFGKNNVLSNDDRLQVNVNSQYVHWFYLTWEAYGDKRGKARIPTQSIQDIGITYSFKDRKYNCTFECRNLTDAAAYDNFKLQKPGRSFSVKFRYFI